MKEQTEKKELIHTRMADEGDFGNTISFVGNLGQDPEMSYTPEGKAQTKISCGVWAGRGLTMWLRVTLWEELAEAAATQLTKGMRVKVVGRLRSYKWQGTDRYEVSGTRLEILTKKPDVPTVVVTEEPDAEKAWRVAHSLDDVPF